MIWTTRAIAPTALAATLGLSAAASAAPTVGAARVVLEAPTPLEHAAASEALVGNGTELFGAYAQTLYSGRTVLRGTFFTDDGTTVTPEIPTGVIVSGNDPRDGTPASASTRPALAMNALGTVLGAYANDVFRIGRDGAVTSIALTAGGAPAAPLFPGVGGPQAAALVGDAAPDAAGTFLFVSCTNIACTAQLLADSGALLGAETPVFAFANAGAVATPALVAAVYVPGQGYRVVAAQGQEVLTTVVATTGVAPATSLAAALAPACENWTATSVRVGRGAAAASVQTRVTTTCDTASATWVTLDTLAPRTETLCAAAAGPDECVFTSTDAGLFVNYGVQLYAVASLTNHSLPGWSPPLRAAPARGGALAVAANAPTVAHVVPEAAPVAGATPWRPLTENAQLYAVQGSTTDVANGADFRGALVRGGTLGNVLVRGEGVLVPFPEAALGGAAVGVAETSGARTFVATTGHLVLFGETAGVASAFGGIVALGHAGESVLALSQQPGPVTPLLYALVLDPDTFGPVAGGALPGTGAAVTKATLVSPVEGGVVARLAFDGTHYLAVFTRGNHLDGALLQPDGTPVGAPFSISSALYRQQQPQVTALAGGGFFVAWTDFRASLAQADVYGTFIGADGVVASPQGIAVTRGTGDEVQPFLATTPDPDHVVVAWSEYLAKSPRTYIRARGAAVSRSLAAARPAFTIDEGPGDHIVAAMLPGASGATVYLDERGTPAGGHRSVARTITLGKRLGQACAANAECVSDNCVQGTCAEQPAAPPGSTCGDPCAVLDPANNVCVPAPRGSVPTGAGCPGYVCNGSALACPTACASNTDCTSDAECENQKCVVVRSCKSETELSDRGVVRSCGTYRCDPLQALCFSACTTVDQCATGLVCDEGGGCVAPPPAAEGGCTMSAQPLTAGHTSVTVLALLGMVLVRRRHRHRVAALSLLAAVTPRAALAADSRVGPSEPLTVLPGATFAPVVAPDTTAPVPLELPGAGPKALFRVVDRAGALRDGAFGAVGFTGWSPARGGLVSRTNCTDGSVLAIERVSTAGRSLPWLVHYTDGAVPAQRIRVPENVAAAVACTSDGAWVLLGEATDAYQRYVWATGAVAQRVATPDTGTAGFFTEATGGWMAIRGTPTAPVIVITNLDGTPPQTFGTFYSPFPTLFSVGARAVLSYPTFDGENVGSIVGSVGIEGGVATYTEASAPALPGANAGTLSPRNEGRAFTYRSGMSLFDVELPPGAAAPVRKTATFVFPPTGSSGLVRGTAYELTFDDGTHREFSLTDLTEIGAPQTLATAAPRALRLATSRNAITRLLGYQNAALTVFRPGAAPATLTLPEGQESQTPADFQALADGSASLITRDSSASSGHVLSTTDVLAPFALLDAATATASLGDGIAAVHFVPASGATTVTYRHISATVGETTRSVTVPSPQYEWGLRSTAAVAAVGNEGFAVFARGVSGIEQHLDWARIKQGTVTENLPLARAFALQLNPKIACDPRGQRGCLVAWEEYRKNDYDADLYVARILPDGTTPDGNGILVAATPHPETEPAVIWTDDDDHFFVAWRDSLPAEERAPGTDPSKLKGAFVRHDGTVEDPGGFDLTDEPLDEMAPALFAAERGAFQLAYQVFAGAGDVSSNQIAIRALRAGKLRGESCAGDNECAGRACIDAICCEATCRDGCGTCNQPGNLGLCVARTKGQTSYQDRCGSFLCDGTTTSCPVTCRDNADCTGESTCDPKTRVCLGALGTSCTDELTVEADGGARSSCLPYRCLRNQCGTRCETNAECAPGNVCTLESRCEPAPPAAEGGCTAASSGEGTVGVVALALLGLVVRTRRRTRPEA